MGWATMTHNRQEKLSQYNRMQVEACVCSWLSLCNFEDCGQVASGYKSSHLAKRRGGKIVKRGMSVTCCRSSGFADLPRANRATSDNCLISHKRVCNVSEPGHRVGLGLSFSRDSPIAKRAPIYAGSDYVGISTQDRLFINSLSKRLGSSSERAATTGRSRRFCTPAE